MGFMAPVTNALTRSIDRLFPGYFDLSPKHDHYKDYGWKETLSFNDFHRMYCRNGLATAGVDKTIAKTWRTAPALWESEKPAESSLEMDIRRHFAARRIWQMLMTADRRGMVGRYSGAILMLRDDKPLDQPVERVPGGIEGLAGIIPAWEGQLSVDEWNMDMGSEAYGEPKAYLFDENAVDQTTSNAGRKMTIHPDRVLIWSEDGTVHGRSTLEPGWNDLIDAEKVKGAGGEGFWKTARGAPVIEAASSISSDDVVRMFGASDADEAREKLNERADDFQSGFDKMLLLGGLTAKPLQITLPQPEEFFNIPVQSFAASMQMPVRILIGNQTGERASTEDAQEWAQVNMSRRENLCIPVLQEMVRRFVAWGLLPQRDWSIGWESLLDATPDQMLDRAAKMAEINAKTLPGDDRTFMPDEIRGACGFAPSAEIDGWDVGGEDSISEQIDQGATNGR